MEVILIGGLWLTPEIWADTQTALTARGHRSVAVALPGQGDGNRQATLDDQLAELLRVVDASPSPPLVVGHSAASTLAWLAVDRRRDTIAGAALVGGFPTTDGAAYADFFPLSDGVMEFPGWEPFAGPDSDDLDPAQREAFEKRAVPVPGDVATATVHYVDDARFSVPVTLVCPEYSPDDARAWIAAGDVPELAQVSTLDYVDLATGHWPMTSDPEQLAEAIATVAAKLEG